MDRQAEELAAEVEGAKVERVGEGLLVTFESGILFDFDSDMLRSAARENLRELAKSLRKYPNTDVLVVGHTDAVGSDAYNQTLSERRARSPPSCTPKAGPPGIARARGGTSGWRRAPRLGGEPIVAAADPERGPVRSSVTATTTANREASCIRPPHEPAHAHPAERRPCAGPRRYILFLRIYASVIYRTSRTRWARAMRIR